MAVSENLWTQQMWVIMGRFCVPYQVLSYNNGVVSSNPRVSLLYPMPSRNVSLRLQDVQEGDSGSYRCTVNIFGSQPKNNVYHLISLDLDVLVPPASPSCHLQGVPRVGNNVALSCQSPRSKPAAQYQWERLLPSSQVFNPPVLGERTS
ncbi:endothelial cell-selective adhesion molecule-like [Echinops telfairi]|uniref:Endothelial cell-selective adhesion molecule-like n=1 Tax=Echinops telfairi TaxID=9371 RepID=A0ABM1VMY9_ECHTE|nr:endothelial cell-selective adhesion molecule-like [Echinops telfairi]